MPRPTSAMLRGLGAALAAASVAMSAQPEKARADPDTVFSLVRRGAGGLGGVSDATPASFAEALEEKDGREVDEVTRLSAMLMKYKVGVDDGDVAKAARRLGDLGDPRALEPLGHVLSSIGSSIAQASPRPDLLFRSDLLSPGLSIAEAAVEALGKLGGDRATELLTQNLHLGVGAEEALGSIGGQKATRALIEAAKFLSREDKFWSIAVKLNAAGQVLLDIGDKPTVAWVIQVMQCRMGPYDRVEECIELLGDPNPALSDEAAAKIFRWAKENKHVGDARTCAEQVAARFQI